MLKNNNWDETKHPRDNEGKFTCKGGSSSKSNEDRIRKEREEKARMQKAADILYPTMRDENKNIKVYGISTNEIGKLGGDVLDKAKETEEMPYSKMKNKNKTNDSSYNHTESTNNIDNSVFSDKAMKNTMDIIRKFEGFSYNAEQPIPGDKWTIGYGHTEGVKKGDTITKEQAEMFFKQDFKKYSEQLKQVKVPLNNNEKAALTSFIYNVGPNAFKNSTLLKKLNNGDKEGAANEFNKWIYKNGKTIRGLVNRRNAERDLFLSPDK